MEKLTAGALGATIVVALGALGFAVSMGIKASQSAQEAEDLRRQNSGEGSGATSEDLQRQLAEAQAENARQMQETREQMMAQMNLLRAQMEQSDQRRQIEASERVALEATLAERAAAEEAITSEQEDPLAQKIAAAPSLGSVTEFSAEWGFVVIDAGSANGVQAGKRFNIRRDHFVVGEIIVREVQGERSSIADVDPDKTAPGLSIRVGDEVIGQLY